jgi:hypothetical protein
MDLEAADVTDLGTAQGREARLVADCIVSRLKPLGQDTTEGQSQNWIGHKTCENDLFVCLM